MHVVFVLVEANAFAIPESGNIFLNRGLNVSASAKGMLFSTNAAAIWTSAEVTCKTKSIECNIMTGEN